MNNIAINTPFTIKGGRQIIFISALFYLVAFIFWLLQFAGIDIPSLGLSLALILGVLLTAIGALIMTGARLEVFGPIVEEAKRDPELDDLRREMSSLKLLASTAGSKVDENRVRSIVRELTNSEIEKVATDAVVMGFAPAVRDDKNATLIAEKGDRFLEGLYRQIEKQRISGNYNLLWGVAFGLGGLLIMGWFIFYPILIEQSQVWDGSKYVKAPSVEHSWAYFLQSFLPRISFVVIFESLSFFFLRAYGQDRTMMRFLRNEATNVEARLLALLSSFHFGDQAIKTHAIKMLMATERNFTIRKGEKLIHEAFTEDHELWVEKISDRLLTVLDKSAGTVRAKRTINNKSTVKRDGEL